eukprot:COSAG06_NODE_53957_length_297_cov_0.777778_1_plen_25_part_10
MLRAAALHRFATHALPQFMGKTTTL